MSLLRMIIVAAALAPVMAEAHPGAHPYGLAESLTHIATQSDHLLALAVAFGWISDRRDGRAWRRLCEPQGFARGRLRHRTDGFPCALAFRCG